MFGGCENKSALDYGVTRPTGFHSRPWRGGGVGDTARNKLPSARTKKMGCYGFSHKTALSWWLVVSRLSWPRVLFIPAIREGCYGHKAEARRGPRHEFLNDEQFFFLDLKKK